MADGDDMMHVEDNGDASAYAAAITAFLAREVISFEGGLPESIVLIGLTNTVRVPAPVPMHFLLGNEIGMGIGSHSPIPSKLSFLVGQPFSSELRIVPKSRVDLTPVDKGFMAGAEAHSVERGMITLLETSVPASDGLGLPTLGIMPANVVGHVNTPVLVDREWRECGLASAGADFDGSLNKSVFSRSAHAKHYELRSFPVQGNDTKKRSELLETLEGADATTWPVTASVTARKARVMRQSAAKRPGNRSKVQRLGQVACSARMANDPRALRPLRGVRYSLGCAVTRRTPVQMAGERTFRPYTGMLDNLSKHPVQEIINKVLKNDAKKGLDGQAWYQFNQTPLRVVASGVTAGTGNGTSTISVTLTTNGSATLTNSVAFSNLHVKSIVDAMKERNIPQPAANDNGRVYGGIAA